MATPFGGVQELCKKTSTTRLYRVDPKTLPLPWPKEEKALKWVIDYVSESEYPSIKRTARKMQRQLDGKVNYKTKFFVDAEFFNRVLSMWSRRGHPDCAKHCERIVAKMEEMYKDGSCGVCPETQHYNTILKAWSKTRSVEGAQNVQKWLTKMWEMSEEEGSKVTPNIASYVTAVLAWDNAASPDRGKRADEILEDYRARHKEPPHVFLASAVVSTWAGLKEGPGKAQLLVDELWKCYEQEKGIGYTPDIGLYTAWMKTWSKLEQEDSGEKAEAVLREVWRQNEIHGGIKGRMGYLYLYPSGHSYSTVIEAWARSGHPDATENCMRLWEEVWARREKGNAGLTVDDYMIHAIMDAFAKSKKPEAGPRMEEILRLMWDKYRRGNDLTMEPSAQTYAKVAMCYKNGGAPDADKHMARLKKEMKHYWPKLEDFPE